jgi:hypothetical protein
MTWGRWLIKPDIVMEAGNLATNTGTIHPADLDDLQLLTTAHDFAIKPLSTFGDTSAATALAAPGWQFGRGSGLTSIGSVHSDVWRGPAVDLASRGYLAVYPTMGLVE